MDPEIEAMTAMANALADLDEDARGRVLRWAGERYGVPLSLGRQRRDRAVESGSGDREGAGDRVAPQVFSHFVDLFDRVNPKFDMERALTAAYWFQQVQNLGSWQAQALNNVLKDVGHGIGNITDALDKAQQRKPALVRQMAKSGRSRQARKTYKLTSAGLQFIGGRIGAAHAEGEADDEGESD